MEHVEIDFGAIMSLLSDKLYSTPAAFIRENVQNAIDAIRMLPLDQRIADANTRIEVRVRSRDVTIEDWGVGMSDRDLSRYFWHMGRSSKQTAEAKACKVIGQFGIGAFANFGVCDTLEVRTRRKGHGGVRSLIRKSDLENNRTGYEINADSLLTHDGTVIIARLSKDAEIAKLGSYLADHVQHVPERVYFNGNLISTKQFPQLPPGLLTIADRTLNFGKHSVRIEYLKGEDGAPAWLALRGADGMVEGLLRLSSGELSIYTSRFLLTKNASAIWPWRLPMQGYINTTFLRPNIAREGMDGPSSEMLEEFLRELSSLTLEVLHEENMLFDSSDLISYLGRQTFSKIERYLARYRVQVFGKRQLIEMSDLIERTKKAQAQVLFTRSSDPPVGIASLATDQDVALVLLASVPQDIIFEVQQFLRKNADAKEIEDFKLNATPVAREEVSRAMLALQRAIQETLVKFWGVIDPEVQLCRLPPNTHIAVHEIGERQIFLVNVDSKLIKNLEEHQGDTLLLQMINGTLLGPFLGEVLLRFLPEDLQSAIARFRPKPYVVTVEKVSTYDIIKGKLTWDGPEDTCIQIESRAFPELRGYYIKLPTRVDELLKQHLSTAEPPSYIWYGDTIIILCKVALDRLIQIEIRGPSLIAVNGHVHGTLNGRTRFLSFRTGTFLPIPHPAFQDILPFDGPKDLNFGFRPLGFPIGEIQEGFRD